MPSFLPTTQKKKVKNKEPKTSPSPKAAKEQHKLQYQLECLHLMYHVCGEGICTHKANTSDLNQLFASGSV